MKVSIVLSTQQTRFQAATFSGELESNLANIASMGYQGVELAIRDPRLVDTNSLVNLLARQNLRVPAIGTGQAWGEEGLSFTDPDPQIRRAAIDRIKSHIPLADRLGANIIIGLLRGIVKPGVSTASAMDWLCEAITECSREASHHGVRLALEPINRYETTLINTVSQGLELVKMVNAENFGLLLDTFHMNIEEGSIEQSIRTCGRRIFHFHVADSNRWHPGAGHLDFASILQALAGTGYDDYVSGEFLPQPDADTAARFNLRHLLPILAGMEQETIDPQ